MRPGAIRSSLLEALLKMRGFDVATEVRHARGRAARSLTENSMEQAARLEAILRHAARTVPHYRRTLAESGVVRGDRVDLGRLTDLGPLRRADLQRGFAALRSEGVDERARHVFVNSSGGSTGEPVRFLQDREYLLKATAARWLFFSFAADYPCRYLRLWGSERDILEEGSWRARLQQWLYQEKVLNAFRMGPGELASFVRAINRYRPLLIEGYVQPLHELARFILTTGCRVRPPLAVFSAAGTLFPETAVLVSQAFQAPVFNRYGTREVGDIACSCGRSRSLHIDTHNCYLEVVDDSGGPCAPGQIGRILVTTLSNLSMPLIRYDIGDLGTLEDPELACPCGRGLPLLRSVEGRVAGVFRTRSGGIVPGEFFVHFVGVVFNEGLVERFQVVQEAFERVRIRYVSREPAALAEKTGAIEAAIRKVMGSECEVIWEAVDRIAPLPSGKYLYVVSEVEGR